MPSSTESPRSRARAAVMAEIKGAARRQLVEVGATGLSLRAVARELGMVSSNVYRYYESRDALLTALIVDAFDAVGEAAEAAAARPAPDVRTRFRHVAHAIRNWARANPNDYALVYGSPVPGYQAPADTIDPAGRVSLVMLRLVDDGVASGAIDPSPASAVPSVVRRDLGHLRRISGLHIPDEVLARAMLVWVAVFGAISYELFGHLTNVLHNLDEWFDHEVRRAADLLCGGAP